MARRSVSRCAARTRTATRSSTHHCQETCSQRPAGPTCSLCATTAHTVHARPLPSHCALLTDCTLFTALFSPRSSPRALLTDGAALCALQVRVPNVGSNSRWYSGSGLHRRARLLSYPALHLLPAHRGGLYLTTSRVTLLDDSGTHTVLTRRHYTFPYCIHSPTQCSHGARHTAFTHPWRT
jgi:hypothetical protein